MHSKVAAIGEAMIEFAPVGEGLYRRGFAGDTFNTIWHMAQLLGGAAICGFVTRVGGDTLSESFLTQMEEDGLDTSGIARDQARTMGLYMIELDGVERSFHYWRGQSAARHLADDGAFLADALEGADLIYLSGITLSILPPEGRTALFDVLSRARRQGAKVAYDPNFRERLWPSRDEARAVTGQILALTDIALPSFDDERNLWGDGTPDATIGRAAAAGIGEVVAKNGGSGVSVFAGGAYRHIDTAPPAKIRDTSGAGDSFNAGYLAARLAGAPPAAAVQAGHRLACEVLGHPGARAPKEAVLRLAASKS